MYDPVTLDQLRAFVAVVEEGSFSAAARKLRRVQSAISTSMANLESQLDVSIWDRRTKVATLTAQGKALLGAARRVLAEVDELRRLSAGMGMGLEPSVALCVDALFPIAPLVALCKGFARAFPSVDLRLDTELMSAVSRRVREGTATLGIVSHGALVSGPEQPGLEQKVLGPIRMLAVVSPKHPLAKSRGPIPNARLAGAIQIVLSERTDAGVADQAVLSPRTWRVADLHTKHMMLCAGLGWGNLPDHLAGDDLRRGRLVAIRPAAWGKGEHTIHFSAVHRSDAAFGPAHRWILQQLEGFSTTAAGPTRAVRPKVT